MPEEEYHSWDLPSASAIKRLAAGETPAHVRWDKLHPSEPSGPMCLGSALHDVTFGPAGQHCEDVIVERGFKLTTKTGRDALEALTMMVQNIKAHPAASVLLEEDGFAEASIIFDEAETGMRCKARPDWTINEGRIAVDLKTAGGMASNPGSPEEFGKTIYNRRYHLQAAFYRWALASVGIEIDHFIFIVAETKPPYLVAVYQIGHEAIERGEEQLAAPLRTMAECYTSGVWPGYPLNVQRVSLPAWAFKRDAT